jgi:hypothetical protein
MEQFKVLKMNKLTTREIEETRGGSPILRGLGVLGTLIGLGKAADQAGSWFMQGWNHPQ